MKKLFILLIIPLHNALSIYNNDLCLNVPALMQQLVNTGKKTIGITTTPVLCCSRQYFADHNITAAALIDLQSCAFLFAPTDKKILEHILKNSAKRINGIAFNPQLFTDPYGVQRLVIFHELYHLKQGANKSDCFTINPTAYPRGIEQEACTQAIILGRCRVCAEQYAAFRLPYVTQQGHLSRDEALTLACQIPPTSCCFYHNPRNARLLTHIHKLSTLSKKFKTIITRSLTRLHKQKKQHSANRTKNHGKKKKHTVFVPKNTASNKKA